MNHKILIAGGAGFIGSHFTELCYKQGLKTVVVDKLTYAGHRANLAHLPEGACELIQADICDASAMQQICEQLQPRYIINFAAESHVDRAIASPKAFVETNVMGTFVLLETALRLWKKLGEPKDFRFLQVSTDEVYGSLSGLEGEFTEQSPYLPNSPYAATKAGSDHLVRAWFKTYALPVLLTHCSNNYGPRQYPEKLIPTMITRALKGQSLGIYGDGSQRRDWLYVTDHCEGIWQTLLQAEPGSTYNFAGHNEYSNLEIVTNICQTLDELKPRSNGRPYKELMKMITDRPGHDWRYAIDDHQAQTHLGYRPQKEFSQGLRETIQWYLDHQKWLTTVLGREA